MGGKKVKDHTTSVWLAGYEINFKELFRPVSPEVRKKPYGVPSVCSPRYSKLNKIMSLKEKQ